jgi:plastocyanin
MKTIFNHDKVIFVFAAFLTLTASAVLMLTMPTTTTLATGAKQLAMAQTTNNNTTQVDAGGGNGTAPLTVYVPQNVTIEEGQSINWINPTSVGEPHSVTFVKESNLFPPYVVPFAVPSTTEIRVLVQNPNVEPLVVPNLPGANNETEKTVIINNGRVFNPLVIDSTGQNVTNLPLNAHYMMDGTETYINSGWIWPEGQVFPGAPPITSFNVTFGETGTYPYICTVHPWMTGTVEVI